MKDLDLPLLQSLIKAAKTRPAPVSADDTGLTHELATLLTLIRSLRDQLEKSEIRVRQLENLAETDELTGLSNRRGFRKLFNKNAKNNVPQQTDLYIVIADLDGFKHTNDQYGHAAGDAVLRHFARLIQKHLPEPGFAARLGGDEFAIAIWSSGFADAETFIRNIKASLADNPVLWHKTHIHIQASFGAEKCNQQAHLKDVLHSADLEMYREKHNTRNSKSSCADVFLPQTG
ncbi:GGDEF domain-containing protein [Thalassospira sp. TSL5-1]|uniref:GGDEF domain-containing protein n=1 Tax=Thalassospira sp. TSL5-1 TaxID=1544451 RepID=UPI00093BE840|nr:GGDEF domain-containing protein [Thalassospira sp. TSL5-1]